jgi:NAD-reducing hydrogenase small subunit
VSKKRLATVWLGGCSGCHMSFLDMDERLLDIAKLADIVKCPVVDTKEFPECDVVLIEGGICNDQQEEAIHVIRERSKVLVSFGDCAVTSNILMVRMRFTKEECLERSYVSGHSNVDGRVPTDPNLPKLIDRVAPLHDYVKVDYFMPGCPPSPGVIFHTLSELLQDRVPALDLGGTVRYG